MSKIIELNKFVAFTNYVANSGIIIYICLVKGRNPLIRCISILAPPEIPAKYLFIRSREANALLPMSMLDCHLSAVPPYRQVERRSFFFGFLIGLLAGATGGNQGATESPHLCLYSRLGR